MAVHETQARRGSPASDLANWIPVFTSLLRNGLSHADAYDLLRDELGIWAPDTLKRVVNRGRTDLDKATHRAARAILDDQPKNFAKAYRDLREQLGE